MITVGKQIRNANDAICRNIELLADKRELLSQNVLSQLRNLVEGVTVLIHSGSSDSEFCYPSIEPAFAFVRGNARLNFLGRLHKLIQKSASHYTLGGDASERLMLKYYEYLHRIRDILQEDCGVAILHNLEDFPINLDPSLREYHEKIATRIQEAYLAKGERNTRERYYIHKTRPFFVGRRIYYEVTFCRAVNKVSKFDRIIAFTDIDISDKYAAMLTLKRDVIKVFGQTMPITIIRDWEVSIRPCEFNNFARLLNMPISVRSSSEEYQYLMWWLTKSSGSLLDLIDMNHDKYVLCKSELRSGERNLQIFPMLDEVRRIVSAAAPGCHVLRYLLLRMSNQIIKSQYCREGCSLLSNMKIKYACIPFDKMPFCTSLSGHNPRYWDLVESLDATDRNHELLARKISNNVENQGVLYTPVADLEGFEDINSLITVYNNKLYRKHNHRHLILDKGHVFIRGYEDDTFNIVEKLQMYASAGIAGYTQAVERWLDDTSRSIDDPVKKQALSLLFSKSRVALIYGAAGTGKSTMVDHIASYFNDKDKLFLTHTNPAIDNLKRKVTAQNSYFKTISSQIRSNSSKEFDVLIIDECSTVSNSDFIEVLNKTSFKLLVLVGDIYQIESIRFGNWFGIIRSFIPSTSVFELTTPFRTKKQALLNFWSNVRSLQDDLTEVMARNEYSTVLDAALFQPQGEDEIILCLNYDGLYGINNINRFLQSSNPSPAVIWCESIYKVGDPVLFYETERFRPVIYNNLKGRIVGIDNAPDRIQFEIELDRPLSEFDIVDHDLEWVGGSTVRFAVYEADNSDDDDDALNTSVPFQVAYAVSIHKAQGLEYDSVKIIITDANEDDITHSIFYTAITRARDRLQVFWTPEVQQGVLESLSRRENKKDVALLASRRGLISIGR